MRYKKQLPKVALNDKQVALYEADPLNKYDIVEEVAFAFSVAHVQGYGIHSQRIIIEDGVYYATWDIYNSCD